MRVQDKALAERILHAMNVVRDDLAVALYRATENKWFQVRVGTLGGGTHWMIFADGTEIRAAEYHLNPDLQETRPVRYEMRRDPRLRPEDRVLRVCNACGFRVAEYSAQNRNRKEKAKVLAHQHGLVCPIWDIYDDAANRFFGLTSFTREFDLTTICIALDFWTDHGLLKNGRFQ